MAPVVKLNRSQLPSGRKLIGTNTAARRSCLVFRGESCSAAWAMARAKIAIATSLSVSAIKSELKAWRIRLNASIGTPSE